jgi:hypothetical protein
LSKLAYTSLSNAGGRLLQGHVRRLLWRGGIVALSCLQLVTAGFGSWAIAVNLHHTSLRQLPTPAPPPPAVSDHVAQLRLDLDYLARELPRVYGGGAGLHNITAAEFRADAEALKAQLPTLDPGHTLTGFMRLLAKLHDGETGLDFPQGDRLPFSAAWIGNQLRLVAVPKENAELVGAQVLAIDGTPALTARARLREVIPAVTDWESDTEDAWYLSSGLVLEGLGITKRPDRVTVTVRDVRDRVRTATFTPQFADGLHPSDVATLPMTLATQHSALPYWWQYLAASNVVYIKYNQCLPDDGFGSVAAQAIAAMKAHPRSKLVVDFRGNGGGNSAPFNALIHLLQDKTLNQPGRIYGVIDRYVFSSATLDAAQLRTQTRALLVGEPTGDPVNQWGDQQYLQLTGYLKVHYSTHYFDAWPRFHGKPFVAPDIAVQTTLADLLAGRDPVLSSVVRGF